MTHSNHRQGTYSNLSDDFVVLGFAAREFDDLQATLGQFKHIGSRHQPVNVPGIKTWHHLVYDSKEKVRDLLTDLVVADLGISITVSGLRDQAMECCQSVGLTPHTINQSLGFWGKTERLPHFSVLEITTMCGHSRISPNLVWELTGQVQQRALNANEAARKMGKLCLCNIFNEIRAAKVVRKLAADLEAGTIARPHPHEKVDTVPRKDFGITIDETKCNGCMECIPYCSGSAIVESSSTGTAGIDAERCTECGICWQSRVCPVEAITAGELTWPRTLRGKYHNMHSPYRATPALARVSQPLDYTSEGKMFVNYSLPSELINDVNAFYRHGYAGIVVELGRPHTGTTFRDLQKVTRILAPMGLQSDEMNPLTDLAADAPKGIFRQDILDEKTGWVMLKLIVSEKEVSEVLLSLQQVAAEIDTIFAVNVVSRVGEDGSIVADRAASEIGVAPACNCKTNMGLGRPLSNL